MRDNLCSGILSASLLLAALGLASCGSNSVASGTSSLDSTTTPTTSVAYLQYNGHGPDVARAHSFASIPQSRAGMRARAHTEGMRIANSSVPIQSGEMDMYVVDTATGVTTKLNGAYGSAAFENVQLSSDGTKLVFTAIDTSGYDQIFMADAKLATITQITGLTSADEIDHNEAVLSADGNTIAFDDDESRIFTIPASGGLATQIASSALSAAGLVASCPAFTPNGKSLVFEGIPSGSTGRIYSVNLDGTGLTQLSVGTVWDTVPTVSPDGTTIAFQRDSYDSSNTYLSDVAVISINGETTTNPATVLTFGAYSTGYSGEPLYVGSNILLFVSGVLGNVPSIFEENPIGSTPLKLTSTKAETIFNYWYW